MRFEKLLIRFFFSYFFKINLFVLACIRLENYVLKIPPRSQLTDVKHNLGNSKI